MTQTNAMSNTVSEDPPSQSATDTVESEAAEKPAATARSGGKRSANLALLLSLAALGIALFIGWQQQSLLQMPSELASSQTGVTQLNLQLQTLQAGVENRGKQLGQLLENQQKLQQKAGQIESLGARLSGVEGALEQLALIDEDTRSAWLTSEAEYYLRIANEQLQLAGNAQTAARALKMADDKLRDLGSPRLTPVRAQISAELTALQALPAQDRVGTIVSLQALSRSLSSLPLRYNAPERYGRDGYGIDEELTGLDRAMAAVRNAFSDIVNVKRDGVSVLPQLTSAEEALLVHSLDLDLQVAGLAFLRGEGELYKLSVTSASERLSQYFDLDSSKVRGALDTLEDLAAVEFPDQLPEIDESLGLLLKLQGKSQ
jgi:uroporphyrin-3 C-methyltransferase